jgi:SNF2 family DNA or RNA helicase
VLTGETKDSDRAAITERFQKADDVRVFLINTTAGGVSITLDAADDIVIADETWVPDEQEQVEDRVHRASNVEHQVDVWYLRTADSIEDQIVQANADKAINNHVVLDRERGLAFARAKFGARNIKED